MAIEEHRCCIYKSTFRTGAGSIRLDPAKKIDPIRNRKLWPDWAYISLIYSVYLPDE